METKTNFYSVKIGNVTKKGNSNVCAEFICSFDGDGNDLYNILIKQYAPLAIWVNPVKEIKRIETVEKPVVPKEEVEDTRKVVGLSDFDDGYHSYHTTRHYGLSHCSKELRDEYKTKAKELQNIEDKIIEDIKKSCMEKFGYIIEDMHAQTYLVALYDDMEFKITLKEQVQQLFESKKNTTGDSNDKNC